MKDSFSSLTSAVEPASASPTSEYQARFGGVQRLYGSAASDRLKRAHVGVIGVGGVGSWAAEALARTGVGAITLVDLDEVCVSNINRQLPALTSAVGRAKAEVMKERILEINPDCRVEAREEFFTAQTMDEIFAARFDGVLDAIDNVANKCLLIARARALGIRVVTSGGAGGRRDPTALRISDLSRATHDRLLQRVRKTLRKDHGFPASGDFGVDCVCSPETPVAPQGEGCDLGESRSLNCNTGYGTAVFVTGAFGFAAASRLVERLIEQPAK